MKASQFQKVVVAMAGVYALAVLASLPILWERGATGRTPGWGYAAPGTLPKVTFVDPRGPAAGILQVGDRILSLDGETNYGGLYGPDWQVWGYAPGRAYRLRFTRAGAIHDVELRVASRPNRSMVPLIASFLFGSLTFTAMAFLMGWQRPELRTARLGWIAAQMTGFVYLALALEATQSLGWQPTALAGILHLPDRWNLWFAYCFLAEFPFAIAAGRTWRWLRTGLAVLCGTCWLFFGIFQLAFVILPWKPRIWSLYPSWWMTATNRVNWIYFACIAIGVAAVLVRNYRAVRDPGARRRIEIVAGASAFGILFASGTILTGAALGRILTWGNLAPLPIPICFAYAVVKHQVLDLRLVVRRSLQHLFARQVLRGLTLLPLVLLAVRATRTPAAPLGSLANLAGLSLIAAAALALESRDRVLAAVDRWFFRETLEREKMVRGLLGEIGRADSWQGVVEVVLHGLATIFAAESVEVSGMEVEGDAPRFPIASPNGRKHGFLVLGPKRSEEPYTAAERELLELVAAQMGLVRDNLLFAAERQDAVISERNRIAREVHDTAGHGFAGISLYLEAARKTIGRSPEEARQYLDEARAIARQSLQETRESVAAIRAPAASDLEMRLRALAGGVGEGPSISVDVEDGVCRTASPDVQWHLARIAEEAVTNARKHSSAREIRIDLKAEGQHLLLRVRDDGGGFDPAVVAGRGYGLAGMRERMAEVRGTIEIATAPGKGTEICAAAPVAAAFFVAGGAA